MLELSRRIHRKSPVLFFAGIFSLFFFFYCLLKQQFSAVMYMGESAWAKPARYAISGWIFLWTMSLLLHHLNARPIRLLIAFVLSLLTIALVFIVYANALISVQGTMDEQNGLVLLKSLLYVAFFSVMLWVCVLFFKQRKNPRSQHYTWGLRMALLIFTGTILLGLIMHFLGIYTVGGLEGSPGIPFFNWSKRHGDLRLVLFLGVHALQVLPLLSHFLFEKKKQVVFFALIYLILVSATLFFTLLGQSFF